VSQVGTKVQIAVDLQGNFDADLLRQWVKAINLQPLLSDAIKTQLTAYPLDPPLTTPSIENWVDFDGTLSVTSTGLQLELLTPDVHTEISWWLRAIAAAVGVIAQLAIRVMCYAFFNVGAALAGPVCAALAAFSGTMVYQVITIFVDHKQGDPQQWAAALALSTVAAVGAAAWESGLNTFAQENMRPLFQRFQRTVAQLARDAASWAGQAVVDAVTWLADRLTAFADLIGPAFTAAANRLFGTRPTDWPAGSLKVMVVGDSMSEGHEGDWTWRYRLWQWFRDKNITVDFVGPYRGTKPPPRPAAPTPPPLQGSPTPAVVPARSSGAYAAGASTFDSDHFALWGRQAAQAKSLIRQQVQTFQPDLLLVGLGFNDMGWFISDANGTLASMKSLVDEARAAKPGIDFALANVPQRTYIGGRDDLITKTDRYNDLLAHAIPTWDTPGSRVELVDWRGNYDCGPSACPAGYDGLHPNALGEYQIARAFEHTLHDRYALGNSVPAIPAQVPARPTPVPGNVTAAATPGGVTLTWNAVFGALHYDVRYRAKGATAWNELQVEPNRYDTTWTTDGDQWEYQVRTDNGANLRSDWSPIVGATAHPHTAPPPVGIISTATATGVDVVWGAPTGPYTDTIDRYGVVVFDEDTPGAYLETVGIKGLSAYIDGLVPGHRYVVAVTTWNAAGGGMPGVAGMVTVGA
jgi:lysophospholipase L1-like esterase